MQYSFQLPNGLRVVLLPLKDSTMAVINITYLVGSRNEHANKTGMAHFLEHVAFGGSLHVDSYDGVLQEVGGINNAYTNTDVTNYWCKLPANQLEVGLYLESDRLLGLAYKDKVIEVQRKVVLEEFKQHYVNVPYGDAWHLLCTQAYEVHPYRWPTIGENMRHIEEITRKDMVDFGSRFYAPERAVLAIVGGFEVEKVALMVKKWFATIPAKTAHSVHVPQEPEQGEAVWQHVERDVPQHLLYKTYHMPGRADADYVAVKLLSNFFTKGKSSLFYKTLVQQDSIFSKIESYTTETMDPGLFVIEGYLHDQVSFSKAERALQALIDRTMAKGLSAKELQRVKNQEEASYLFDQTDPIHKAEMLAQGWLMGDVDFFDKEIKHVQARKNADMQRVASQVLQTNNSHTLYYEKKA